MRYVGMQTQIQRNNMLSIFLLLMFPTIILGIVWVFLAALNYFGNGYPDEYGEMVYHLDVSTVNYYFITTIPWVVVGVLIWFVIAYFGNVSMVQRATGARPVTRKENPRLYNIVENLCMTCNMDMPKINVVDDPQLNAFASGINAKSYTVTVTTGLMELLDDDELAGVLGHELTHIRNHDTKLLITSIIFVGIISTIMSVVVRMMYETLWYGGGRRRSNSKEGGGLSLLVILLIGVVCCAVAYIFTLLTRFAISRKREYMADAGGAELCGNPLALASALRKISHNPGLDNVKRADVAQLFIIQPDEMKQGLMSFMDSLFSTHPDTEKRIAILEQF
ncbi:MAG: M48 family metallopeptidase [Segatella oris]|uniref:M48 family metallopeptidase n=1 Tax=Segatella oris TaxID=28135 RepID=UPI003FA2C35B